MWGPLGSSWYDSIQTKLTERYSNGLDFTMAFTWQKELATGQNINDAFQSPESEVAIERFPALDFRYRFQL